MSKSIVLIALVLALCAGCSRESPAPPPAANTAAASAATEWAAYVNDFIESYLRAQPFWAVDQGRHEFDGQMPDWSAAGLQKEVDRLKDARAKAEGFAPDKLTPAQRFERQYILSVIDRQLFWQERAQSPQKNPAWYLDRLDPDVYLSRDYAPLAERMKGYIGYARAIPQAAANIRANLRTPLPKTLIERGIGGFGGYAQFYRNDVPKVFASVQDAQLQQQLAAANDAAAKAMEDLRKWLESERKHATTDFALGPELFSEMLRQTERVDVPVKDLKTIGQADLERNLKALREACAQYLPHGTLQACVAKEAADKPTGGAVQGARDQLEALRAFIREKNLVSIPTDEQAHVEEAPPYNRANSAYINVPGPYEKKSVAWTYFVAPPDPSWTAAERAAYIPGKGDLLYTTVHEVWPGHFLQFQHANHNPSKIAGLWVGYAFAEGWAHYSEELMWESGLGNGDPEQHIGQLTNALLRNVRFISAIGLHTEGMSVAQSEKLFRESAFQDPGNARQQAARGTYDPGYLAYTLGKLMIRKLRADWLMAKQSAPGGGGDQAQLLHDFHDQFLSYGGPPIPLVREQMMGQDGSLF